MKEITFDYGIFGGSLEEQANQQGYTFGEEKEKLEKIVKAINMCKFYVATESQVNKMFDKFNKMVIKSLKEME